MAEPPKKPPATFRLGFGGDDTHPMQRDEARRKLLDRFEDSKGADPDRYKSSASKGPAEARRQLSSLHPMLAGQRSPKPALLKLYLKLVAEAKERPPLEPEEQRALRRGLVLSTADEAGLSALLERF